MRRSKQQSVAEARAQGFGPGGLRWKCEACDKARRFDEANLLEDAIKELRALNGERD